MENFNDQHINFQGFMPPFVSCGFSEAASLIFHQQYVELWQLPVIGQTERCSNDPRSSICCICLDHVTLCRVTAEGLAQMADALYEAMRSGVA